MSHVWRRDSESDTSAIYMEKICATNMFRDEEKMLSIVFITTDDPTRPQWIQMALVKLSHKIK